jgi:hypothetical protein
MPRVVKRSASLAMTTGSSRRGVPIPSFVPPQLSHPVEKPPGRLSSRFRRIGGQERCQARKWAMRRRKGPAGASVDAQAVMVGPKLSRAENHRKGFDG